ncbi:MAG: hypothetical protein HY719_03210 [Planctomycetes bacterium]|nr:hypothetical protein [Planctomycetota bacterium]
MNALFDNAIDATTLAPATVTAGRETLAPAPRKGGARGAGRATHALAPTPPAPISRGRGRRGPVADVPGSCSGKGRVGDARRVGGLRRVPARPALVTLPTICTEFAQAPEAPQTCCRNFDYDLQQCLVSLAPCHYVEH